MSEILKTAHLLAKDLSSVGAMSPITMRMMDELCIPAKPSFSADEIKTIREKTSMSQAVFALFLNVGHNTVAQWEQGKKKPSGPSARLLQIIDRKGVDVFG